MRLLLAARHLWRRWYGHKRCLNRIVRLELELALVDFVPLYLEVQCRLARGRPRPRSVIRTKVDWEKDFLYGPGQRWPLSAQAVSAAPTRPLRRLEHLHTVSRQALDDPVIRAQFPVDAVVRRRDQSPDVFDILIPREVLH